MYENHLLIAVVLIVIASLLFYLQKRSEQRKMEQKTSERERMAAKATDADQSVPSVNESIRPVGSNTIDHVQMQSIPSSDSKNLSLGYLVSKFNYEFELSELRNSLVMKGLDAMDGHDFEYFVAGLLEAHIFDQTEVTKGSGDFGVDIVATNRHGTRFGIQCKRFVSPLGLSPIQEVVAGLKTYNCNQGMVVTNSTFSESAKKLAEANDVILFDRNILEGLMFKSHILSYPECPEEIIHLI